MTKVSRSKHIIAIGGGGFGNHPALDRYILSQACTDNPAICLVPTASGDAIDHIENFYTVCAALPCIPTHLSLFNLPTPDLRSFVLSQDIVYVSGGNTRSMLALWREWELDRILREAWEQGIVLAGRSAGAICWFEQGVTDSIPGSLNALPCLGFLPGSACPHYDSELERRPAYHRMIVDEVVSSGYAMDDGAALHFVNDELTAVTSSHATMRAYRVEKAGGIALETPLSPEPTR